MTIHQDLARKIMADLRNRNELHKILAPTDPGDGTPWADLKQQAIIEERLAAIIFAGLVPIAAEMTELREKVETLENALEPFSADADKWADSVPDDYRSPCIEPGAKKVHPGSESVFTVGDLRRARAILGARS